MARFTEVCGTPTEPLGDGAAELALELDKFLAVLRTVHDATLYVGRGTAPTDQIFLLVFTLPFIDVLTTLQATEVRLLAFEAHVIRQPSQCILFRLVVELVGGIVETFVLIKAFVLESIEGLLTDILEGIANDFYFMSDLRMLGNSYPLPARWTVTEGEGYPRAWPTLLYPVH